MFNYFKDFKNEKFHDNNLINLIGLLSQNERLDLFENLIGINNGTLGNFIRGKSKRDFDVHLNFENYHVIIETKVDSAEGERNNMWQTDRIFQDYSKNWNNKSLILIYLTYGLSEYYIKIRQDGSYSNGPFSTSFQHIGLKEITNFIERSIEECVIDDYGILTWLDWLKFELTKRDDNQYFLENINNLLIRYKATLNLTDYPVNRLNIFVPEFTIPFYFNLCKSWNNLNNNKIGKACLYPMGRRSSQVNDSILNFWELWNCKQPLTAKGLLHDNSLYFEFNEDFNLHLKAKADVPNLNQLKELISSNRENLSMGFTATQENYRQGTYVLFEWDLKVLSNSIETNVENIRKVIENAIEVLE
ncbi:MAG: hypothetical protein K9I94_05570 [Bacteroidales bacterium]|nr:hypothetical protein [Bacteroidales bacterium]